MGQYSSPCHRLASGLPSALLGMRTLFCNCVAEQGRVWLDGPPRKKATLVGGFAWWTIKDSNLGPTGYEPVALTN